MELNEVLEIQIKGLLALVRDYVKQINQLEAELAAHLENEGDECPVCVLEAENQRLRDGHDDIIRWGKAYTIDVFQEPDMKKAHELLKAGGMTLDAVSASAMRHVLKGVVKIAEDALKDGG